MHMALLAVGRVALLTASSVGARAQAGTARQGADPRCLASIPDSAMRRVEVVLEAELTDSTDGPILPELDLFAQSVADEARALLGASHDSVPAGEPTVTWQGLGASLSVVVRRDGHITTTVPTFDLPADVVPVMAGTAAAELLERGVAAVDSAGGFVMWPDGFAPDSVAFRLVVRYPGDRRPYGPPVSRAASVPAHDDPHAGGGVRRHHATGEGPVPDGVLAERCIGNRVAGVLGRYDWQSRHDGGEGPLAAEPSAPHGQPGSVLRTLSAGCDIGAPRHALQTGSAWRVQGETARRGAVRVQAQSIETPTPAARGPREDTGVRSGSSRTHCGSSVHTTYETVRPHTRHLHLALPV